MAASTGSNRLGLRRMHHCVVDVRRTWSKQRPFTRPLDVRLLYKIQKILEARANIGTTNFAMDRAELV